MIFIHIIIILILLIFIFTKGRIVNHIQSYFSNDYYDYTKRVKDSYKDDSCYGCLGSTNMVSQPGSQPQSLNKEPQDYNDYQANDYQANDYQVYDYQDNDYQVYDYNKRDPYVNESEYIQKTRIQNAGAQEAQDSNDFTYLHSHPYDAFREKPPPISGPALDHFSEEPNYHDRNVFYSVNPNRITPKNSEKHNSNISQLSQIKQPESGTLNGELRKEKNIREKNKRIANALRVSFDENTYKPFYEDGLNRRENFGWYGKNDITLSEVKKMNKKGNFYRNII